MVDPETVGTLGVGIGAVLVVFDFTSAGIGVMLLGIAGAIAVGATGGGGQRGRR